MIKMVSLTTLFLICIGILSVSALKYDAKAIDFDAEYLEKLQGSEMKFYSLKINTSLKENDLLIDAKTKNKRNELFESPIVLVSLVNTIF
jgi:hypothetical protein